MSRSKGSPQLPVEDKLRVVLAILAGELTVAEAARRHGVCAVAVSTWRDRFIGSGKARAGSQIAGPPGAGSAGMSMAERRSRAEAEQLALAEATVQLRIWQKGAEHIPEVLSLTPFATPRP